MATRSAVILADELTLVEEGKEGLILEGPSFTLRGRAIYGHWDGYPSWTGRILSEAYGRKERAEALIAHGDFSILGPFLSPWELEALGRPCPKHTFSEPCPGVSVFYGRDRKEKDTQARVVVLTGKGTSALALLGQKYRKEWDAEYVYLGLPEGERVRWFGYDIFGNEVLRLFELYPSRDNWAEVALRDFVEQMS